MKLEIKPRLASPQHPTGESVENLRPAFGGFENVCAPRTYTNLAGWRPLCPSDPTAPDGEWLFARGSSLVFATPGKDMQNVEGSLPSAPTSAEATADGILVMTSQGPFRIIKEDGSRRLESAVPSFPAARINMVFKGPVMQSVGERKLSRTYLAGEQFAASDIERLGADFTGAYASLASQAAGAGLFIQPVLVRCHYYDAAGRLLHRTSPVLVAPEADRLCGGRGLYTADGQTVRPYNLEINAYAMEVCVDADPSGMVARVEVCTTPQFHPWATGKCTVTPNRTWTAGQMCTVTLPGASRGLSASHSAGSCARVGAAVAHMEQLLRPAAQLGAPGGAGISDTVANPFGEGAAGESQILEKALGSKTVHVNPMEVSLTIPHTFGAGACGRDSDTTLWGNLRAFRYGGASPREFAADTDREDWTADAAVWMSDGSVVRRSFSGSGASPKLVWPLVAYPAPDAVHMSMIVRAGRIFRAFDAPLTPSACGRYSIWISPTLAPVEMDSVPCYAPSNATDNGLSYPGALAVAHSGLPLTARSIIDSGCPAIAALSPLGGSDGNWEFGRCRFIAAGDGGVLSVAWESGSGRAAVRSLWSGPCRALTWSPEGVYCATARGLLRINSSSRRMSVIDPTPCTGVAWLPHTAQVVANTGATLRFYSPSTGHGYWESASDGGELAGSSGRVFLINSENLTVLDRDGLQQQPFRLKAVSPLPAPERIDRVHILARGQGTLRCTVSDGDCTLATLTFTGSPDLSPALRVWGPVVENLQVEISGAGKWNIRGIRIWTKKP